VLKVNGSDGSVKICSLKPSLRELNVTAKIIKVGVTRTFHSRRDGRDHMVAEAFVGDETGSIILTLWDEQIRRFKAGDTIKITNGYTTLYRGSLRLNVGKNGKIERAKDEIERVNTQNNLSERLYIQIPWHLSESSPYRRRRRR